MKRAFLILFFGFFVAGMFPACGPGMKQAMQYGDVHHTKVTMPDDTYRVFDHPEEGKLMITGSMATAMKVGLLGGFTFGAAGTLASRSAHERAGLGYLTATGRDCEILDSRELIKGQWEVSYECHGTVPPDPDRLYTREEWENRAPKTRSKAK